MHFHYLWSVSSQFDKLNVVIFLLYKTKKYKAQPIWRNTILTCVEPREVVGKKSLLSLYHKTDRDRDRGRGRDREGCQQQVQAEAKWEVSLEKKYRRL